MNTGVTPWPATSLPFGAYNAAPEWQATSYGHQSGLIGGLSTPGACSKVSHLHRQNLRPSDSPVELMRPPAHVSNWHLTPGPRPTTACPSSWGARARASFSRECFVEDLPGETRVPGGLRHPLSVCVAPKDLGMKTASPSASSMQASS
jgi:hypothetical protein